MVRDYELKSPSLEGVLTHGSITYGGLKRPVELLRVLDGPAAKGPSGSKKQQKSESEQKILESYFHDLYGVFMKKLAHFVVEPDPSAESEVNLLALLQEMVKIKKLMRQ